MGQISVYDNHGKMRRRTVSARTQAEVEERMAELRAVAEAAPSLPVSPTLSQFLTYWLDEVLPSEGIKSQTIANYASMIRRHVDPTIGRTTLRNLAPADIRRMLNTMDAAGKSPATRSLALKILRRALKTAEHDELVTHNVATRVKGVPQNRSVKTTLSVDQAKALVATAREAGEEALVVVMLGLGLRRGETLGLRWRDLNLTGPDPRLTVMGAVTDDGHGRHYFEGAKAGSERTLDVPAEIVRVLERHRARQAAQRLAFNGIWAWDCNFDDMVFTTETGDWRNPDTVSRLVKELADEAGVGHWTPHGLRHSAASILIAEGVPLKVIQELLGHSHISVTADIYTHLQAPAFRSAADAMQRALFD
jgi:integrase